VALYLKHSENNITEEWRR